VGVAGDVEPRTLPPPAIDPGDLQAIFPSLTPEDASLYASLATLALQAVCWPNALPAPLPPPLNAVGLAMATRLAASLETAQTGAGQVVSESIGAYTYRLASPVTVDAALQLTEAERKLIRPWLGQASVYDVALGTAYVWPPDWWARNYDLLEYPPGTVLP
jgi:hypothetical protein